MNRFVSGFLFFTLLLVTFIIRTYHAGTYPPPQVQMDLTPKPAIWIPKEKYGMNQLILRGTPFERGLQAGRLTSHLLEQQEDDLVKQMQIWIPSKTVFQALVLGGSLWFTGAEKYFENWMIEEMYGVSQSAPRKYDFMADGLTRQVAYHGLHEVGQMLVDSGIEGMGCTLAAVPWEKNWILGRNFDFEAGRIFDTEKILKWVFPDQGHAFVSVIWAGMVGAVTGVNDQGLYLSLNAAGSSDFRRIGTPSTLLILKVLQEASSAEEAIQIMQDTQMFITDIFVLLDTKAGKLYRIEKSPEKMEVIALTEPHLVANHLVGKTWETDSTNRDRKENLTSSYRQARGEKLLAEIQQKNVRTGSEMELEILRILRDKGEADGERLHFGNRRAIDPLIATHSVVYNGSTEVLYVSQGPGVSGAFTGFDLKKSFQQGEPVVVGKLPHDPEVSDELFTRVRMSGRNLNHAQALIRQKKCKEATRILQAVAEAHKEQHAYYEILGNWHECLGEKDKAREAWQKSLALHPAYRKTIQKLEEKVRK